MPFYETRLLFHKIPVSDHRLCPYCSSPIELPSYRSPRNNNQHQLFLDSDNKARIVEINIGEGVYTHHADLTGDRFNSYGGTLRRKGLFVSDIITWKPV